MAKKQPRELDMDDEQRLKILASLLVDTIQDDIRVDEMLKEHPGGYWFDPPESGGQCQICRLITRKKMWQDKYGFRCETCQQAYKKRRITKAIIMDPMGNKWVSDSQLAEYLDVNIQLLQAEVSRGKYKVRSIEHEKYSDTVFFLESENPIVTKVLASLGKSSLPSYSGRMEFTPDGTAGPPAS